MRMTNKIMQNNSLYNINQNKILQDKLSTQMSTQQKLTRPSDDPVVAIRALRLRTSVAELTQFYEKNAPDASNWLDVTKGGLESGGAILKDLMTEANKGANKEKDVEDLEIILTQMKSYTRGFYDTGNLDYGGRYVFTGYRTDTPLSFTTSDVSDKDHPIPSYDITEQTTIEAFDICNYTYVDNLAGTNITNYQSHQTVKNPDTTPGADNSLKEQVIENSNIHRLRLAYDKIKNADITLTLKNESGDVDYPIEAISSSADPDPYRQIQTGAKQAVFVPETGEILFSDNFYDALSHAVDSEKTEMRINYTKNEWNNGDLRPEHYFACKSTDSSYVPPKEITYNPEYLDGTKKRQTIEYDVGYNQRIDINTTADEVFTHTLNRDMDDLENILNSLKSMKVIKNDLEQALEGLTEGTSEYKETKKQLDAANKAYSYLRENMHTAFENMISKAQKYIDDTNVAVTDNGTRMARLDLIKNRLMDQKTSFEDLQVENEGADITEVAVELTSAQLTYDASLMATSKIMQTTLMNYI